MTNHHAIKWPVLMCAAFLWSACGGGGSSSSGDGSGGLAFRALWEQPSAARSARGEAAGDTGSPGFGPELPASVKTVRMYFASETGENCCVAIDPDSAPVDPDSGQRFLLLKPLPPGPGTIMISGFPTDFAPTVNGVSAVCSVAPEGLGQACDRSRIQAPSFTSDEHPVTLARGVDTDAGDILIRSLPFLPNDGFRPEIGTEPSSPVSVEFTVIDATSGIDPNSINVSITQNGSQLNDIDVSVRPCDDATPLNTCSPNGELDTEGFIVETEPQLLSPGDAEFRVRARNKAPSPQALEFRWTVRVLAAATPTRQPTATPQPTSTPQPTATTVPTARPTPRPTFTATLVPTRTRRPSPVPTLSPTRQPTLTPSLTATITISPTPTATRTPKPPCSESISLNPCIPGGGTARTACYFEWLLDPVPERNNSFIPKSTTTCYEGDPECDSDGLINGICRFEVAMCINNLDPRFDSCRPTDLDTFEVLQPNPASPDGDFDAQNSAMLENEASNGFGVTIVRRGVVTDRGRPNATVGLCSPFLGINVRVGSERPGRDTLRIRNTTSDDESTSAAVTLRCAPSTCGNGTVEEQEECDDGNRRDGDGCDQGCQFEIGNGAAAVVGDPAGSAE